MDRRQGQARHQRAYRARKKRHVEGLQQALDTCHLERDSYAERVRQLEERVLQLQDQLAELSAPDSRDPRRPALCNVYDAQAQDLWEIMPFDLKMTYVAACLSRQPPEI